MAPKVPDPLTQEVVVAGPRDFVECAAKEILSRLRGALKLRETAVLALAGGETPRPVYRQLARSKGDPAVDWGRVDFYWSDERFVDDGDPDSNVGAARRDLLEPLGISPRRLHPPAFAADPATAAHSYENQIRREVPNGPHGIPRFDLVLLGVGADGHTASLFPGEVVEPERLVVAARSPVPPRSRISFSFDLLAAAGEVFFLVSGSAKAEIVRRALEERDQLLPAARVRAERVSWVLDRGAASRLAASGS